MRSRLVLATLTSVCLAACMGTSRQADSGSPALVGNWIWTETSGGKTGAAISPKSEGYSLTVRFDADGTFEIRRDDTVWQSGSWEIASGETGDSVMYTFTGEPSSGTVITWSGLGSPPRHLFRFDESGALILDEGCCDRYQHIFNRSQ